MRVLYMQRFINIYNIIFRHNQFFGSLQKRILASGMEDLMGVFKVNWGKASIDLCGLKLGMTEHFRNPFDWTAVSNEVSPESVPQGVGSKIVSELVVFTKPAKNGIDGIQMHSFSSCNPRDKDGTGISSLANLWSDVMNIIEQ